MASQRRFEGPVLEDLLDRVRADAGPGAQIVAANRVRKGGLGGFFAKEYFEVVVDVANDAELVLDVEERPAPPVVVPAPDSSGLRRVPASILDLAEEVNDTERHRGPSGARDMIDLVDDAPPPGPPIGSANASRFASILENLTQETETAPGPTPAPAAAPAQAPARRRTARSGIADEVRERLEQRAEGARRTATAARVTSDPITIIEEPEPVITPTALGAVVEAVAELGVAKPAEFRRVPKNEPVIERPETVLARLGLPARLVPRGASMTQLRGALIESLADLPAPPPVPDTKGVVIAVVGPGASAVLLARELCADYGLDPERIVLATEEPLGDGIPAWLQICDGATADERRRSWRRRTTPTLVALSLPPGRDALPWARGILDQLEPTIAWSIVNAGWKSEDARDWIERLGGVDALALTHSDDTVSPAAILDLGIAVGRVEGRPATALEWAELLMARMQ
ncbi:MAG: hypothetical protein QOI55_410 [Actinomycetota bacterium]|nr:hypothetical protein [Actinomycetota bacterium]